MGGVDQGGIETRQTDRDQRGLVGLAMEASGVGGKVRENEKLS